MASGVVLVVDDDGPLRADIVFMLGELGYETIEAADGEQGEREFLAHPSVCVVLSDFRMPVRDGIAMHQAIRDEVARRLATFILMTGDAVCNARIADFCATTRTPCLSKPFAFDELQSFLADTLGS